MKRIFQILALSLMLVAVPVLSVHAQDIKLVTGRIINKTTRKPFDAKNIIIYTFNTTGEAEDAYKTLTEGNGIIFTTNMVSPDASGYYEVRVAETGAIIVKEDMVNKCAMEQVNYRMEINFEIEGGNVLDQAVVSGTLTEPTPLKERNRMNGNNLEVGNVIPLPAHFGKTNARMILQPVLYEGGTDRLVKYLKPLVYDGEQYKLTQERRMGYVDARDPLFRYVSPTVSLVDSSMRVNWADTIKVDDPSKSYYVRGVMRLEDYNKIYYERDMQLASARSIRPLKFLEYSIDQYELDPNKYRERPRRERRNTAGNISLTFLVGKAQLDENDTLNRVQLDKLKTDLLNIVNGEGSQLKEFHITGVSSPDGTYSSNLNLAKNRMKYAMSQIISVLPKYVRDRVYMPTKAEVAPWSDVADLLEADSLTQEAADIRAVIEKYPGSHDAQGLRIRRLPYYKKVVTPYLPKLRSVTYEYMYEIYRELTPEEILERYNTDEDYRSGRKQFALYEYWHLFQLVKNEDELIELYKRAYKESVEARGTPWALAANNLAVAYLKRGIVDTTILAPLINTGIKRVNIEEKRADGTVNSISNPEAVVANQVAMFLKANNFERASVLSQILPNTPKNKTIKSFTMCLGGYYTGGETDEEKEQAKEVFNTVAGSSPLNKVVMYLAMETRAYDMMAENAIRDLPQGDALTDYLWAIIKCRNASQKNAAGDTFSGAMLEMDAENYLVSAFSKDKKFIGLAASDGDILEQVFKNANETYELSMM